MATFSREGLMADNVSASDPWTDLIQDPDLEKIRPLLVAARNEGRLSSLFPVVSHLTELRLIPNVIDRSAGQVWITLSADGNYRVKWTGPEPIEKQCHTIAEAITAALRILAEKLD
jgi:hypothetical protein